MTPASKPVEQLEIGEDHCFIAIAAAGMSFGEPGNKFPVGCRKLLLLVSRPSGEFDDFLQGFEFFAGAGAHQLKTNAELMARGILGILERRAQYAQSSAGRVEMSWPRGKEPILELFDELLFVRGFLNFGKAVEVRVAA